MKSFWNWPVPFLFQPNLTKKIIDPEAFLKDTEKVDII